MVNRYTSERRIRSDDAYTPNNEGGKRPDRATIVYTQRCREAFNDVPVVIGGIEASLRRIAHFDYWQEKIRRSVLLDAKADMLLFGNAERAIVELTHRLAGGESIKDIRDLRGSAYAINQRPDDWVEIDSSEIDQPGVIDPPINPYQDTTKPEEGKKSCANKQAEEDAKVIRFERRPRGLDRDKTVVRLPSYEQVKDDAVLYAHASRILHLESNPGNARALIQSHAGREVWINPPPIPLHTPELDKVFELLISAYLTRVTAKPRFLRMK